VAKTMRRTRTFAVLWRAVRESRRPGAPGIGERLSALPRLIAARLRGDYRDTSGGRLGLMALAVLYIVSPIDLVPEGFLLVFGIADDAFVAMWLAGAVIGEADRFLAWERSRSRVIPGEVIEG
jgi:uncharacterized membrane protein YkvA (DUF1232 family)